MAASLIKILPTYLRRKVPKREQDPVRAGTALAGRQITFDIRVFQNRRPCVVFYAYNDVSHLEWVGDRKKQEFRDLWDHVMDDLEAEMSSKAMRDLFASQIAKSEDLKEDYAHYKRFDNFGKDQNFKYL